MKLQDALIAKLLAEARSNPELNPKISAYMALKPYSNNDDYYVSFTEIDKIGINPGSTFRTPLGIYAYPLKEIWQKYNIDRKRSIGQSVPFAGERPHVWLFKLKKGIKFVKSSDEYTFDDLSKDTAILIKHVLDNKERYYKSFDIETPEKLTEGKVMDSFSFWARRAKMKTEVSKLWNITRNLAFRGRDVEDFENRTSIITNWNTLLYKVLGYYGFADKTGTGYIHDNEPVQAVFFTKSAFEIEKEVLNKDYDAAVIDWLKKGIKEKTIEVGNPVFLISGIYRLVLWKSGTWKNGTWIAGTWENGTWKNGTWESGTWENGTWENGTFKGETWENGTWENGTWKDGRWRNGTWKDGTWKDGIWFYGVWEDGTWENGTWHGGRWRNGAWKGGLWKNGTWENGTWENGIWENGTWKNGVWEGGWIYDPNKKGNFKPDWKWDYNFVESPISPAEYFKTKVN